MTDYKPIFPAYMEDASFWESVILDAQAERLLKRIEDEREPEPGRGE